MTSPQIVKIHDLFMTIQVSNSDSGLFRFIHNCGHPEYTLSKCTQDKYHSSESQQGREILREVRSK